MKDYLRTGTGYLYALSLVALREDRGGTIKMVSHAAGRAIARSEEEANSIPMELARDAWPESAGYTHWQSTALRLKLKPILELKLSPVLEVGGSPG